MNVLENAPDERPRGAADTGDRRKLVLLVEDSEADRDIYGGLLWYNGYNVVHAETGEEAIDLALEKRPALLLVDVMLAGELTGIDVVARLRAEMLDVPMVMLSAVPREELEARITDLGITMYLEKPIDPFRVVRESWGA